MKRQAILNKAQEFFRDNISSELRRDADWECWESAALAIIAVYLQQDLKEISFKQVYNHCQYRELVRLAELLTWSGTADDVQTILHVCKDREAHKRFFSVVKTCFENKTGNIPYFGQVEEVQQEALAADQEAEIRAWYTGYERGAKRYEKFSYKMSALGFLLGVSCSALLFLTIF